MSALSLQNSLGVMVREERKGRRMTQQALAQAAEASVPTVRLLEQGG